MLVVGMLGLFFFDWSELVGLCFELELWDVVVCVMGEGVFDEGYFKLVGEFKVYGSVYVLGGKLVQEMLVFVKVGSVFK